MEANELDNDEIEFGHGQVGAVATDDVAQDTDDDVEDEVADTNVGEQEVEEEEKEEKEEKEEQPTEETTETTPKKDSKQQALDYERSRRKQLEKELRQLKAEKDEQARAKEEEETLSKERESLKQAMLEGDLIEEDIADKLVDTIGKDIIKMKLANKRLAEEENFERQFTELKKDDMYMDADKYKDKIKDFVAKGLTMEEAYGAAIPASRYASLKKDLEIEIEQRLLNSDQRAEKLDIGHREAKGEEKRTSYTREEQAIAKETGLDVKEVRKRANMHTLDEFLNL